MGCLGASLWVIMQGVALTGLIIAASLGLLIGYYFLQEVWLRRPWHD